MKASTNWHRLGVALHYLSFLKLAFYALGLYYQLQAMIIGSREKFVHNLYSMLLMYGLAMLLEALRDNEEVARSRRGGRPQWTAWWQRTIAVATGLFLFAVLLGAYFLFVAGDRLQGDAIVVFGVGGLALMRLEYDCLGLARANEKREEPQPAPADQATQTTSPEPVDVPNGT